MLVSTFDPFGWGLLAYLDPGTGSYALQILLASLFGASFALKQFWGQTRVWLADRTGRGGSAAEATNPRSSRSESAERAAPFAARAPIRHG